MPVSLNSEGAQLIIGLCKLPGGRSAKELAELLERNQNSVGSYASEMVKAGELYRGGVVRNYRYFGTQEEAEAFTVTAEADLLKKKAEATERRKKRDIERARRQTQRKTAERRASRQAQVRSSPARIDLAMRDSGRVIATRQQEIEHKRFHAQANIVWPPNVKITIIPTGVDTRFVAFVEPGKGQISQDQRARWKAERHAR